MDYRLFLCLLFAGFSVKGALSAPDRQTSNYVQKKRSFAISDLIPCGLTLDAGCFFETADGLLVQQKDALLGKFYALNVSIIFNYRYVSENW